jgi:hypothetical protein
MLERINRVSFGRMRGRRIRFVVGICALVLGAADAPAATVLAPPGVVGTVAFNLSPPPGIDIGTFGTFPLTGPGGHVEGTVRGEPSPFLSTEATTSNRASLVARASSCATSSRYWARTATCR